MRIKKSKNKKYSNKHHIIQVILRNIITLYYYVLYNAIGQYLIKENIKDNNLKHKTKLHQPKVEL